MKPLVYGAVLGVLWLLLDLPIAAPTTLLPAAVQPVTVAFVLGVAARPYLARRRWAR